MAGSLIGCLLSFVAVPVWAGAGYSGAFSDAGMNPGGESIQKCPGTPGFSIVNTDFDSRYFSVPVANGCLGMMPTKAPMGVKDVMLSNVYDGHRRHGVSRIAQGPNPFVLKMSVDGVPVSDSTVTQRSQTLDMRRAWFGDRFVVGDKAVVDWKLRALRELPYAGLVSVEVRALQDVRLGVEGQIVAPKNFVQLDSSVITQPIEESRFQIRRLRGETPQRGVLLCAAAATFTEAGTMPADTLLRAGETLRFHILGSLVPGTDFADPWNEAERFVIYGLGEGPERLVSRHEALWEDLWQGDIIIDGDPEAQVFARAALFQLYSNAREGRAASIPPFGLSDREYCGHIFWDSELWMYPPMLFLNQDIARSMVDYRTRLLPGALRKAACYGYRGAMFPWESDDTGDESCPTNALTGTFEHHISSDVAIGIWNYFRMTGDREWLRSEGWPVLREVAEFWMSRVEWNPDGSCSIRGVVGADEFAHHVTDNAFTNASAIVALRAAVSAARLLATDASADRRATRRAGKNPGGEGSLRAINGSAGTRAAGEGSPRSIGGTAGTKAAGQAAEWGRVADALRILRRPDGVTDEFEGYAGQTVKQADVNLLAYPLQVVTDPKAIRRDLEFYEPRIHPHGPAMSQAILALQWARLGEGSKAYELYQKGLEGHLHGPFLAFSETAGHGDTCFMTGLGGFLQLFINGFCGLELTDGGVVQLPAALPPQWKSITVTGVGPERRTYTNRRK
jgi:trehalose/maltose hydrolase-like predicted phosphorylase